MCPAAVIKPSFIIDEVVAASSFPRVAASIMTPPMFTSCAGPPLAAADIDANGSAAAMEMDPRLASEWNPPGMASSTGFAFRSAPTGTLKKVTSHLSLEPSSTHAGACQASGHVPASSPCQKTTARPSLGRISSPGTPSPSNTVPRMDSGHSPLVGCRP